VDTTVTHPEASIEFTFVRKGASLPRRVVAALACLTALFMAACGEEPDYQRVVARAGQLALREGSALVYFRTSMELPEGAGEITGTGRGVADFDKQQTQLSMSMSSLQGPMEMEMVSDGLVMYMKVPALTQMLPKSTPWIKMDLEKAGEQMGIDLGQMMQLGQNNPAQGLEYLAGAEEVARIGGESVRGVHTTHYEATLSYDRLAEEMPSLGASVERIKELTGIEEIPADVWIDNEGLARRMRYEFEFNPPEDAPLGTPEGKMTMVMEFYDYGTEADIELPPTRKVTDITELVPQE
jgi:hypothetical protein